MLDVDLSDFQSVVDDLLSDVEGLQSYLDSPEFRDDLRQIVGDNFDVVFDSEGAAISEYWGGNDLVDTGDLRQSLTDPGSLKVRVSGKRIIFESRVAYAPYVSDRYEFYGFTSETESKISALIESYLSNDTRANWS